MIIRFKFIFLVFCAMNHLFPLQKVHNKDDAQIYRQIVRHYSFHKQLESHDRHLTQYDNPFYKLYSLLTILLEDYHNPQTIYESYMAAGTDFGLTEFKGGIFHFSDVILSAAYKFVGSTY